MSKHTNEELMARYKTLPKELQEAILSVDTSKAIQEIGKKYGLAIDKIGALADETSSVMLGFERADNFVSNLNRHLGTGAETAAKIGAEINSAVFSKIRSSLRKIQSEDESERPAAGKEEVLKEIEAYEKPAQRAPDILKGTSEPLPAGEGIFEAKMPAEKTDNKKEVFRMPKEETNHPDGEEKEKPAIPYSEGDPYRESIS